jgi:protein phosphatase
MSPCETSKLDGFLEHPLEAFSYFSSRGIGKVVCEEKHMGSRAVVIICRSADTAEKRFGVTDGSSGICYTRTGRRFFDDDSLEEEFLGRIRGQLEGRSFFKDFNTEWVILDCELMPWSAKAQALLKQQYAPAAAAGIHGLQAAIAALRPAAERSYETREVDSRVSGQNLDLKGLLGYFEEREAALERYAEAYRVYCWHVDGLDGIKLAPFHILASEGGAHTDKGHTWHMENISKYCAGGDPLLIPTPYFEVDTTSEASISEGVRRWLELTEKGGEGMVVKPSEFIANGHKGLIQPAVKCRGREYLRIIYGPEYMLAENLPRLKSRSLARKRTLALKEFSLGVEALERFVRKEPFYRVHECVFAVLALESEPVDPRL